MVRVCAKMVRMEGDRLGSRTQGSASQASLLVRRKELIPFLPTVAYLVIYHILFILFVWSYTKAILTSPGFARDVSPSFVRRSA